MRLTTIFFTMQPSVYRELIKHHLLSGKKALEIFQILVSVYGQDAPSRSTVERWVNEFKRGRQDTQTRPSTGRPPEAITDAKINEARLLIVKDPKLSCKSIAGLLVLSECTTRLILQNHLGLKKMLARWVPYTLSDSNKTGRVKHAREFLRRWGHRWSRLRSRLVTVDETYVSYKTACNRLDAAEWRPIGSNPPEVPRLSSDKRKLMAIVFWDAEGLVHLEWFKPTTQRAGLTSDLYADALENMYNSISRNNPRKAARGLLLLQDNAPCHTGKTARAKLQTLEIETTGHPPYSPDLAPSDYYLFRVLKNYLKTHHFSDDDELREGVASFFEAKTSDFYLRGIDQLKEKYEQVIESRGEYLVE